MVLKHTKLRMVSVCTHIARLARAVVATYEEHANRDQLEDAAEVLAQEYASSEHILL